MQVRAHPILIKHTSFEKLSVIHEHETRDFGE